MRSWILSLSLILCSSSAVAQVDEAHGIEMMWDRSQAQKFNCTPEYYDPEYDPEIYDKGCSQRLTRADHRRGNWWAKDWPQVGGGPYLQQITSCDIATEWSGRGCYKVVQGSVHVGTFIKQVVKPMSAVQLLYKPDEMAVCGTNLRGIDMWFDGCMCDQTDEQGNVLQTFDGPYANSFTWVGWAEDSQLHQFASYDFTQDPGYWDAYDMVYAGFEEIRGWGHNSHTAGSWAQNKEAWEKRHTIAGLMARGPVGNRHPELPMWVAAEQAAEYVLEKYIHQDLGWLSDEGWPASDLGDPALTAAIDNWYDRTDSYEEDPLGMYLDTDVGKEGTTWGRVKRTFGGE